MILMLVLFSLGRWIWTKIDQARWLVRCRREGDGVPTARCVSFDRFLGMQLTGQSHEHDTADCPMAEEVF